MMQESFKPFTKNGRNNFEAIDWGHKEKKTRNSRELSENQAEKSTVGVDEKNHQPKLTR